MTDDVHLIEINGARLGYQTHAALAGLPPLVFVHGYSMRSTGRPYRALFAHLEKAFTVHALDLRGHGASAGETKDWSMEAWADDVAAFADALGLEDAVYAGHSIGGFTGLYAALRHPGTFKALCLLATAAASGGRHNPPGIGDLFVASGQDEATMREVFAPMYVRGSAEDVADAAAAIAVMPAAMHQAFFPAFAGYDLTARLGEIDIPVLVLNGRLDGVVPPAEQHATAEGLRHCKEVTLSAEGHMLPIEAPALTAREIAGFVLGDLVV